MANNKNSAQPVDVLAVMDSAAQHAATLRTYARDTGAFRVTNAGASTLADACAAALAAIEARAAVAELLGERNRLANIVDSHEAQILRMTADMAELVEAAKDARDARRMGNLPDDRCEELAARYCGDDAPSGVRIVKAAEQRLDAALARVQGGAA